MLGSRPLGSCVADGDLDQPQIYHHTLNSICTVLRVYCTAVIWSVLSITVFRWGQLPCTELGGVRHDLSFGFVFKCGGCAFRIYLFPLQLYRLIQNTEAEHIIFIEIITFFLSWEHFSQMANVPKNKSPQESIMPREPCEKNTFLCMHWAGSKALAVSSYILIYVLFIYTQSVI